MTMSKMRGMISRNKTLNRSEDDGNYPNKITNNELKYTNMAVVCFVFIQYNFKSISKCNIFIQ